MSLNCDTSRIVRFFDNPANGYDDVLIQHLDACERCRAFLNKQVASDEEWNRAREMLQPNEFDVANSVEFAAGGTTQAIGLSPSIEKVLDALSPTDDPNRLGRLGVYEISGVIGIGGMGVVLKAVEPALDRVVAIKVMSPNLAGNDKARQRFAREARAAAAVLHPNVIPIHSVSNDENLSYLVMAYVPGGSLQKRIDQQGSFSLEEILRIGTQIASGLAASHQQGLVHRDIKPENVLLEGEVDRVTITDFGLARAVDDNSLTQVGTIAGTPMYMSPEQARGEQVDYFSDMFSLGSVLYALCTGEPPFRADTSYSVMRKIIDESPTPIRDINPDIPEWLESIIAQLMERKKSDRFSSADEVRELLERYLSHVQQPDTVPLPNRATSERMMNESPAKVIGLASIIVACFVAVAIFSTKGFWSESKPIAENKSNPSSQTSNASQETGSGGVNQQGLPGANQTNEKTLADLPQSEIVWIINELMGTDFGFPRNARTPNRDLVQGLNQFMDLDPESRETLAKKAVESGKPEVARILLAGARVNPVAGEAMKLANMLMSAGDSKKAIDAYLDAFRIEPLLFRQEHVVFFEAQSRIEDLANLFTEARLKKTRGITVLLDLLEASMKDDLAATTGIPYLERLWKVRTDMHPYFNNTTFWSKTAGNQMRLLRARWIPKNFDQEAGGWDHFCRVGVEGGWRDWLEPLIANESTNRQLIEEVRSVVRVNKNWEAGIALLAILEAESGNFEPAQQWIADNLSKIAPDGENVGSRSVPVNCVRYVSELLEGKDDELDLLVKKFREQANKTP